MLPNPEELTIVESEQQRQKQLGERCLNEGNAFITRPAVYTLPRLFQSLVNQLDLLPAAPFPVKFALMRSVTGLNQEPETPPPFSEIARPVKIVNRLLYLEKRMAEGCVSTQDLEQGIQRLTRSVSSIVRALPDIFARFRHRLRQEGFQTSTGQLHGLLQDLQNASSLPAPFNDVKHLTIHGLSHLNELHYQLVQQLIQHIDQTDIRFHYNPERREAFRWVEQTLQKFERSPHAHQSIDPFFQTYRQRPDNILRFLTKNLFRPPEEVLRLKKQQPDYSISFLESSTPTDEVDEVTHRIHSFIQQGTSPHDICIIYREGTEIPDQFARMLQHYGIPYQTEEPRNPNLNSVSETVLLLLETVSSSFPVDNVQEILRNNLLSDPVTTVPSQLDTILNEAGIHGGSPENWLASLEEYQKSLQQRIRAADNPDEPLIDASETKKLQQLRRQTKQLQNQLPAFFSLLTPSQSPETLEDIARWTRKLIREFHLSDNIRQQVNQTRYEKHALRSFSSFREFLQSVIQSLHTISGTIEVENLEEGLHIFRRLWKTHCSQQKVRTGDEHGVHLLPAESTQGLTFSHVFIVQLDDETWPKPIVEDPFLQDDLLRAINREKQKMALTGTSRKRWKELYLFYRTVCSAINELHLSWSKTDITGNEQFASPFLKDIKKLLDLDKNPSSSPDKDQQEAPSPAASNTADQMPETLSRRSLMNIHSDTNVRNLSHRIMLERRRKRFFLASDAESKARHTGPWAGKLTEPDHLDRQSNAFLAPDHKWSPSALEQYAQCPYAFYSNRILDLSDDRSTRYGLDTASEGRLIHEILRQYYQEHTASSSPTDHNIKAICRSIFSKWETLGLQGDPYFWKINQTRIFLRIKRLLNRLHASLDHEVLNVETSFGRNGEMTEVSFPNSDDSYVIRGRIDRMDLDPDNQTGFVWDYKNTRKKQKHRDRKKDESFGKTSFQLPAYLLAAHQHDASDEAHASRWTGGFIMVKEEQRNPILKLRNRSEEFDDWIQSVKQDIRKGIQHISRKVHQGDFSVDPDPCLRTCPYRSMCRYVETGR